MNVIIRNMCKPEKCCLCPLFRYEWEDGNALCKACNETIAEIPYEDRLLDSALLGIETPQFCPLVEISVPLSDLVNITDIEEMLENAQIIGDDEYCGYCTEDVRLSNIPRLGEE